VAFPWDWLDRFDDHVYVSLGTLSQGIGDRFLGAVLEAVAGKPYGVVMIGAGATLPPPPDNVLLCDFVPQLTLVPRMKAVLCHGGHNTTVGTLAEGIPLIVAPIRDDQPIIADMVAKSGAGVRLNFVRAKAPAIADAFDAVLYNPAYREAAQRIARSFEAGGGAPAAADQVEKLVGSIPAYTF
jgi:UDP:flavonoid glycosyltransferase YjiC (YdhE family)